MAQEFVGGLRLSNPVLFSRGATFTWPLARLTITETGIVLSVRRLPTWFFGGLFDLDPIEIPYEELLRAEPRKRHGVRFHTQTAEERGRHWDRRNGATFSTLRFSPVRAALEQQGVVFG